MNVVHFGEDLQERAPGVVGSMCVDGESRWITDQEIFDLMQEGEQVTVRAASPSERKRAEAYTELYELGRQMAPKYHVIYDHLSAEEVHKIIEGVVFSLNTFHPPVPLLDQD